MDYLQLEFPIAVILVPTIGEAWSLISYHTFSYYIPPQIIKINDLAVFIGMKPPNYNILYILWQDIA